MRNPSLLIAVVTVTVMSGAARADYPIVDAVAEKVINKYQTTSCDQLKQEAAQRQGKPPSDMEKRAIEFLHNDPGARAEFFNKVSAPIVTKMFECGVIP